MTKIGILHPGEMGSSIAASAISSGHQVYWVSQNRSDKTRQRAERQNLIETHSLAEFCRTCDIILCICPPHAAEDVARLVSDEGFGGFYLDANAISPQRAIKVSQLMEASRIRFIDGGIIGGPAWKPNETWLYLSGNDAEVIADCFRGGPLGVKIVGEKVGKASALKMCYAAYSKGTTALLATILAASEVYSVHKELCQQWDTDDSGFSEQVQRRVKQAIAKAWRFEGEMREIASTLREAGMPDGFHHAAAEVYHRMAILKNDTLSPTWDEIFTALTDGTL